MTAGKEKDQLDGAVLAPLVMESLDVLMTTLSDRLRTPRKSTQRHMLQAAQALAVIAMADQFLASMPVEIAHRYRTLAKEFNVALEKGG